VKLFDSSVGDITLLVDNRATCYNGNNGKEWSGVSELLRDEIITAALRRSSALALEVKLSYLHPAAGGTIYGVPTTGPFLMHDVKEMTRYRNFAPAAHVLDALAASLDSGAFSDCTIDVCFKCEMVTEYF